MNGLSSLIPQSAPAARPAWPLRWIVVGSILACLATATAADGPAVVEPLTIGLDATNDRLAE